MQHRHSLGEVDDVDVVAGAEDVILHLRVPAVGLMTEMYASLKKLAHRIIGKRHWYSPVVPPRIREPERPPSPCMGWSGRRSATGRLCGPRSACEMGGL